MLLNCVVIASNVDKYYDGCKNGFFLSKNL